MCQFFASGGQSIGASASVLSMNIQDWSSLGWTGLIFLQSKGLLRVFSNTTVQKHQFFGDQLYLWSSSHIHTWLLEKPPSWVRKIPGEGHGNPLSYSCLEKPMDRGAWWATVQYLTGLLGLYSPCFEALHQVHLLTPPPPDFWTSVTYFLGLHNILLALWTK